MTYMPMRFVAPLPEAWNLAGIEPPVG
jgi:hypothetical protein